MESKENLNVDIDDYNSMYRLPDTVKPIRYKLTLDPDLEKGTFTGDIVIDVEVKETTQRIFLNAHGLTVIRASMMVNKSDSSSSFLSISTVYIQAKRQLLILHTESPLLPSSYTILLSYEGKLSGETVGIFRTRIDINSSRPRYCMATYFEPTYARSAFPCFDEPHMKAKYVVSLIRPAGEEYVALSNSSVKVEVVDCPRKGVTTVHFNETHPISSYLTCFIVGVYQRLEPALALSGRCPVSVYSHPSLIQQTIFARNLAARTIDYFSHYFQIDYPFPKLDLIAVPDSTLGGMENWGLITFRETGLLLNADECSTSDMLLVVTLVIHELSHMWFGNLVTISWWDDTWLKEGMADFMSYIGGNHTYPSWYQEWVFLKRQVLPGLHKDSALSSRPVISSVSHPDQIREMFDTISYLKGSCLVRMLHNIDNTKFRRGLMNYVSAMKWSNAKTADLWQALSESMGWFVGDAMGTWTEQAGYPVVTVNKRDMDCVLTQSRFLSDSTSIYDPLTSPYKYTWDIPIKYVTSDNKKKVEFLWFNRDLQSVTVPNSKNCAWLKFNWHCMGFYRVNYSLPMWETFSKLLQRDISVLDAEDRCSLIDDAFSLARSGYIKYDVPMTLILYLQNCQEDSYIVWSVVRSKLESMQVLLTSNKSSKLFSKYVNMLLGPNVAAFNWNLSDNLPFMERRLKAEVIGAACSLGMEVALNKVRGIFTDMIERSKYQPCNEIRTLVHQFGLSGDGNKELWEKTWYYYLVENNPREIFNLLKSLASTYNPHLITRLLREAKDHNLVRSQNFFPLLQFIAKNPVGNKILWTYIREEWPYLVSRFTLNNMNLGHTISSVASNYSTSEQLAEVEEFFAKYPEAGAGQRERKHTLESIKANIRWKNENNDYIDQRLNAM